MSSNICKKETFNKVYKEQVTPLRNFLYYRSGDLQLAEDLAQESFIKLWKNCASVAKDKVKSFLFTVGKNLFLNHVKHQNIVLKFEKIPRQDVEQTTPETLLESQQLQSTLEKAVSDLPEKQREVFLMHRIDQLKYREIAEHLGISVKAVEKRMHKALIILKEVYNNL